MASIPVFAETLSRLHADIAVVRLIRAGIAADKISAVFPQRRAPNSVCCWPGVISGSDLTKRKVVTEGGTYVGQVVSVELDPATYRLTAIEVSPGFFRGNKLIPDDQVTSLGADVVIVSDMVCAPQGEDLLATEGDALEGR